MVEQIIPNDCKKDSIPLPSVSLMLLWASRHCGEEIRQEPQCHHMISIPPISHLSPVAPPPWTVSHLVANNYLRLEWTPLGSIFKQLCFMIHIMSSQDSGHQITHMSHIPEAGRKNPFHIRSLLCTNIVPLTQSVLWNQPPYNLREAIIKKLLEFFCESKYFKKFWYFLNNGFP